MTSRSFQNLLVDRVPILRSSVSTQQMHSPLIYGLTEIAERRKHNAQTRFRSHCEARRGPFIRPCFSLGVDALDTYPSAYDYL